MSLKNCTGLCAQMENRQRATEDFRRKWGGVIHPDFGKVTPNNPTGSSDLSSNLFVGTASQKDVIESLINGGNSGNLSTYIEENNINLEELSNVYNASAWTSPIKQTALREKLAVETKYLNLQNTKASFASNLVSNLDFTTVGAAAGRARTSPTTTSRATPLTPLEPLPVLEEGRVEALPINNTSPQPETLYALENITQKPAQPKEEKSNLPLFIMIGVLAIAGVFLYRRLK
jgi:hypothetical protein